MREESQQLLSSQQQRNESNDQRSGEGHTTSNQYESQEMPNYGATTTTSKVSINVQRDNNGVFEGMMDQHDTFGISWHNLTVVHPKSGRTILENVSGFADSGQLVALMGASGAGKTTLLNTLLSRNMKGLSVVRGQVLVGGNKLGESITYISGYVQQDELFMGTLTVREHLLIQARLRLVDLTWRQIRKRVNEIIEELGLQECRNSRIGYGSIKKGISGGEMRRLLFASELLNNPQIIFADEPTTGLDSSMAESVINVMQKMARAGRTVICTIHQPSSTIYKKFDKVIFLATGRVVYFGEPYKVVELLNRFGFPCPKNYNPADAIIQNLSIETNNEEECHQRIRKICTEWEHSPEGIQLRNEVEERKRTLRPKPKWRKTAGYWVQITSLLRRSILDNWRNPSLARAKLFQKFVMGLFIGLLYIQVGSKSDELNGAMYYIVAELTYATLFGIISFMPADFPLLTREYHDGLYNTGAYYVARVASYIPLFTVDGILMVTIAYFLTPLVPSIQRFLIALGISILVEQSAAAFGVMLSTVSPNYPIAISVAGPILTILTLTGGYFANVGVIPSYISWIQYLSWFRYGFEAIAISQWEGAFGPEEKKRAQDMLGKFSFNQDMFYIDLAALLLIILTCYSIGYLGLLLRVRMAR